MSVDDHIEIIKYFETTHRRVKSYTVTHSRRKRFTIIQFGSHSTRCYKIINNQVVLIGRN